MKFYTINQNNSGGYFIQNAMVDHLVCIQAANPEEAENKLMDITSEYSDYCECCGERWYINLDENDGTDFVSNGYGEDAFKDLNVSPYRQYIVIHYADGRIKKHDLKTKNNLK